MTSNLIAATIILLGIVIAGLAVVFMVIRDERRESQQSIDKKSKDLINSFCFLTEHTEMQ
jgi:hypothetical protein